MIILRSNSITIEFDRNLSKLHNSVTAKTLLGNAFDKDIGNSKRDVQCDALTKQSNNPYITIQNQLYIYGYQAQWNPF